MHGVFIEEGLSDWQIVQHRNKKAEITLSGSWIVPKAAVKQGVEDARPMVRVLSEDDNSQIIPWTYAESTKNEDSVTGSWSATLTIPAGGLYRIETGLETKGSAPGVLWVFRGDTRLHIGVGDVFLIGGQSNSAGYGKDIAFDPPELGVHLYRNRHVWDLATHPMNESAFGADAKNAEMGVSGTSPYLSFGKNFRKFSHYPVGLVATAMGGQAMKRWNPEGGKLYLNMVAQAKACGGDFAGVLWYQGCSDTDEKNAPTYKEKYYTMINAFRKELGYDIPFFTFQLNRQIDGLNDPGWGVVREAQRAAAKELPKVYILPTMDCSLSDAIHNDAHSCMRLGERMARLCGNVLYDGPEFFAPEISSAVCKDTQVTLSFANMQLGFIVRSPLYENLGLTFMDDEGEILFERADFPKDAKNTLTLTLNRKPVGACTVSYGWQANPTFMPLQDEVTYLPLLSFYQVPVDLK